MIVYIIFFLLIVILLQLGKWNTVKGINFYKVTYILIFLFCAIRFDVGYDFMHYYDVLTKNMKFYEASFNRLEYLNQKIIIFSQFIGFPQIYYIVTSYIIVFFTYKAIKINSNNFVISTLVFISFPIFFFNSLSIIRQYVAVAIIFYAFQFIKQRKLIKFLLAIGIAFLFHKSAIIGVLLYWLYGLNFKNIYLYILFILSFFSSELIFLLVKEILPHYAMYLERKIGIGGDKILLIFQMIAFLLLFLINKNRDDKDYNFYIFTFFVGIFIWSSLAPYGHAGYRGAMYFIVFFILLLPKIINLFKQRKILEQITYLVCSFFFIVTLWLGTKNPKKDPNIPYRIYFLTDKNIYKQVDASRK